MNLILSFNYFNSVKFWETTFKMNEKDLSSISLFSSIRFSRIYYPNCQKQLPWCYNTFCIIIFIFFACFCLVYTADPVSEIIQHLIFIFQNIPTTNAFRFSNNFPNPSAYFNHWDQYNYQVRQKSFWANRKRH